MHVRRRLVGLFAATACSLGLVASGLVPATAAAAADPMFGAPTVGTCRNYDFDGLYGSSETSAEVDCATQHTAKIITVFELPSGLDWSSSQNKLQATMAKHCFPDFDAILGGSAKTRVKSAYGIGWFIPTKFQRNNGARWIRCDVVLNGGKTIRPLPTDTQPFLPSPPLDDSVARCLTTRYHLTTTCNRTHNYRASAATQVKASSYPGYKTLFKIASRRCPNLVSTPNAWYATYPSRISWRAGRRLIVCFSKVSN